MGIVERILAKRGIRDVTKLSKDERSTYEGWKAVLSAKDELEPAEIGRFCRQQASKIESRWSDMTLPPETYRSLVAQHVVYRSIEEAIGAPKRRKEELERVLEDMLSS